MTRANLYKLALPALALFATLGMTRPAAPVGPPWISLELPVNPMEPSTRGAALVVHTFHHQYVAQYPISGQAEGLVDGERRSIPLKFRETSRDGVYALDQQWPSEGDWILTITTGANADITLVVELGPDGGVRTDRLFDWRVSSVSLRSTRAVMGGVDAGEVDAALRALAAGDW